MRSSPRSIHLAFATSAFLFAAVVSADEPKELLPAAPPAPTDALPNVPPAAPDRIAEALAPQPGGLTPKQVGELALRAKPSLRVKEA
ncbi:MAG TPA: TolC family protein, partial [Polyangium sp.]|nr:TolC family protein [Polyangium sp.]